MRGKIHRVGDLGASQPPAHGGRSVEQKRLGWGPPPAAPGLRDWTLVSTTRSALRPLHGGVQARHRVLLTLLGVLVTVVGLAAPSASAHTAAGARNGVAAVNPETGPAVAATAAVSPALVGIPGLLFDDGTAVSLVTLRGGAGSVRVGQAGENAVRGANDIGPKATVNVNGRTRILDGLTDTAVTEVKNVSSLSYTQQLKDSLSYAQASGRRFDLYVRADTYLSGPLRDAIARGDIALRFIP